MKRIALLGGALLVSGVLVKTSCVARELMVGLFGLGVAYFAGLLLLGFCIFVYRGAARTLFLLRLQAQRWNRGSVKWVSVYWTGLMSAPAT